MIVLAYLVPVLSCLLLYFGFHFEGEWQFYAILFGGGEVLVALLHWAFFSSLSSCKEYLGGIVTSIYYEEPWTEIVIHRETYTDSNGKTRTRIRKEYKDHPEEYSFYTSIGTYSDISASDFRKIRDLWNVPGHTDIWRDEKIKGGIRMGCHYDFYDMNPSCIEDNTYWVPVTVKRNYKNKIRSSNSIFKFQKISKSEAEQLGLPDYPELIGFDAPCVLSEDFEVLSYPDRLFRKFNAGVAPRAQMRLYILLFEADKGVGISELQRAYWQGGNKNEFVICIGLDHLRHVAWAHAFSWADEQQLEVEVAQWLMQQGYLDWDDLYEWMKSNLPRWKRKEFKDFDYIRVSLPLKRFLWIFFLTVLANGVALWFILRHALLNSMGE